MKNNFKNIFNTKKIGIIIYGRMSSKRFPGKVLHKVYKSKNTFQIIVDKIKKEGLKSKVVVATSNHNNDKKIVDFCRKNNIKFFCGDHENVFNRTVECIKKFKFKYFVRICADRPLFDIYLMIEMVSLIIKKDLDIVTNANPRTFPKGLTCEVAKTKIFNVDQKKLRKTDKEHIFNYFYRKDKYRIYNLKGKFNKKFLKKNFCIDVKKDIKNIRNIFYKFSKIKKEITINHLFKFN